MRGKSILDLAGMAPRSVVRWLVGWLADILEC